jgi:hypothetical protein
MERGWCILYHKSIESVPFISSFLHCVALQLYEWKYVRKITHWGRFRQLLIFTAFMHVAVNAMYKITCKQRSPIMISKAHNCPKTSVLVNYI